MSVRPGVGEKQSSRDQEEGVGAVTRPAGTATSGPTPARAGRKSRIPAQPAAAAQETAPAVAESGAAEFVAFEMQGETFAFPMERVQEIIRMPELVRVPLGPPGLEGLANLRGRVLPVVCLRSCCGLPPVPVDDATRVVVVEASGATLGFVVDKVTAVTTVEAADIESADSIQATVRSDLLAAVVKGKDGRMTTVLDIQRLVDSEFTVLVRQGANSQAGSSRAQDKVPEESQTTVELVSFSVDGQEYALPIDRVREIVQTPDRITTVPNADARVVGVMDLRGGLLPVISLRQVFGLPSTDLALQNRIIVVTIQQEGREGLVGVVLDTVREVLRVPAGLVGDLPSVVNGANRRSEVRSVCRLEDGRRLVSVLSADALMNLDDLDAVVREVAGGPQENEDGAGAMTVSSGDGRGGDELLVVFRLADGEYCVDVDTVQEIIRVPESLIRVPGTSDYVEGLVNLRGIVLPVVDLRTRLGLPRAVHDERQRIVVLILDGVRTGFVVDSVAEVLKVSTADLEPAPELSEEQAKVVTRVANLADQTRMLLVLETGQLLASSDPAVGPLEPADAA